MHCGYICLYFNYSKEKHALELNHLSLAFPLSSQLKMFGSFDGCLKSKLIKLNSVNIIDHAHAYLVFPLALSALQLEDKLLGGLSLLPQNRLRLATESLLFSVISAIRSKLVSHIIIFCVLNLPPSSLSLLGLG